MNYCHTHDHSSAAQKVGRAFAIAIFVNLGFTFLEAVFALYAHSSSLLADAGHNLGDVLGLAFAWGANYLQTRRPTDRFSYGYKRTSVLAAFLNAVILIATAIMIAVSAVQHLFHPHIVGEKIVIIVAIIGIFLNMGTALLFRHGQQDINVKAAFLHLVFDALISLGVVVAAIAIYYTGWYWLDPVVGLLIMIAIISGTWSLFKRSIDLMLDAVPHELKIAHVAEYLQKWPDVTEVHDLHIWGLSTTEVALTAHLFVPSRYLDDNELLLLAQSLQKKFGIGHVTLQIERGTMCLTSCRH
ncbi:MAG: cation diffusion facilitator family transporter [Pseudomonadota bacterium]